MGLAHGRWRGPVFALVCWLVGSFALSGTAQRNPVSSSPVYPGKSIGDFYDRLAGDLKQGKPLVVTVYVALCDNASQGIVRTKNPRICQGDHPERNLYWASSGGLMGHLRTQPWKRVLYRPSATDKIAITGVWTRRFRPGGALAKRGVSGRFPVYVVGLGYRGTEIHGAMVDYLKAVSGDRPEIIDIDGQTTIQFGGGAHIVGYVGHDYFMDVRDEASLLSHTRGQTTLHKGVFGLACHSDNYFRPAIQRRTNHILALNTQLTFPSAFTVLGIIRAVAAGKDHRGIHREAARAFAKGQRQTVRTMLRALSYGDKPLTEDGPHDQVEVVCRQQWGAKPMTRSYRDHHIHRITLHHQGVRHTSAQNTAERLKKMQQYHQSETVGFNDIAYHFIIDPNGGVYEGRPFNAVGETQTDYDPTGHLLICLLGDFDEQTPTKPAIEALTKLSTWAVQAFDTDVETIQGHRDHTEGTCPGSNLYRLIQEGTLKARVRELASSQRMELHIRCEPEI